MKEYIKKWHSWTYEDDLLCCKKYWEYLLNNARNRNFEKMTEEIKPFFSEVEFEDLQFKLRQIRELAIDYRFYDGMEKINYKRRSYSFQLNRAFLQVIYEMGIEKEKERKSPGLVIDTVEFTYEYKQIENELEELLSETKRRWRGIGACHMIWSVKEDILREKFNIIWKCPSALNPHVLFD